MSGVVGKCISLHLGTGSPIGAYRAEMLEAVEKAKQDGASVEEAWLQAVDAQIESLLEDQLNIIEGANAAYAETPAGKKKAAKAPKVAAAPVVVTEEEKQAAKDRAAAQFEREYAAAQASMQWNSAGSDFDTARSKGTPKFENLRREVQADWFKTWLDAEGDADGLWAPIEKAALQFEVDNDLREDISTPEQRKTLTPDAGATGGSTGNVRSPAGVTGSAVPGTSQEGAAQAAGAKQPRVFRVEKPRVEKSTGAAGKGTTVAAIQAELKKFLRGDVLGRKVIVVQQALNLPGGLDSLFSKSEQDSTQGFVFMGGKAYLIADNIPAGQIRSVFMHEVGGHLGLQQIMDGTLFNYAVVRITQWAGRNDNSLESRIAQAAMKRANVSAASGGNTENELVAYFLTEAIDAGINPKAANPTGPLATLISQIYNAFKAAAQKLTGANADKFTAQDMVDLAYGAAQIELRFDGDVSAAKGAAQPAPDGLKAAQANMIEARKRESVLKSLLECLA